MAKASVIIKCEYCGSEFKHEKICRNRSEADNYEDWAKNHIDTCPECFRKQREEEKMQKAAKLCEGIDLPTLVGTEKQTAWAEKIRADKIVEIVNDGIDLAELFSVESDEAWRELLKNCSVWWKNHYANYWKVLHTNSAKWFIDNRY